ncbi:uncharacterized protein LOC144177914 [Haemaphysalis longicornis]
MVSSNHFLLFVQLSAVIATRFSVCAEQPAPGTTNGTCPILPEPCCPVPIRPPVPVTLHAVGKPTPSTSSSHPGHYKYRQPCTAHLSGHGNGAAAAMVSSNHFLLFVQGRLEGLELGVPAACFGQRFCAWGAPCADVSDRARRGLFTARPRRLSIVSVRLGLRYAKALHARLGAWSPHQQPPGMLQRRLPAGPLSAFSTLSRRRIDVAFT